MAKRYGIEFALVSDPDNSLAKQFVGVDNNDLPIPTTLVILPDRSVAARVGGKTKDQRLYAAALVAVIDDAMGTPPESPDLLKGYRARHRSEIRGYAGVGGGFPTEANAGFRSRVGASGLVPLAHWLAVGGSVDATTGHLRRLNTTSLIRLRKLKHADVSTFYLDIPAGAAFALHDEQTDLVGVTVGARAGIQFAAWPSLAMFIEFGSAWTRFSGTDEFPAQIDRMFDISLGAAWLR